MQYDLHCIHFICHSQDVDAHIISPFVNFQESTPTITQVPAYFSETNDSLSSTNQEGLELKNNHSTVFPTEDNTSDCNGNMIIDHVKFTSNKEVTSESLTYTNYSISLLCSFPFYVEPWYLQIVL